MERDTMQIEATWHCESLLMVLRSLRFADMLQRKVLLSIVMLKSTPFSVNTFIENLKNK